MDSKTPHSEHSLFFATYGNIVEVPQTWKYRGVFQNGFRSKLEIREEISEVWFRFVGVSVVASHDEIVNPVRGDVYYLNIGRIDAKLLNRAWVEKAIVTDVRDPRTGIEIMKLAWFASLRTGKLDGLVPYHIGDEFSVSDEYAVENLSGCIISGHRDVLVAAKVIISEGPLHDISNNLLSETRN